MNSTPELAVNPAPLPAYAPEALAQRNPDELLELLIADEDRAPRTVIDECACREDAMVERLATLIENEHEWSRKNTSGEWWLRLHAVMILGLIPGARAGHLLVNCMRRMEQAQDENLQDWLAGYWPALFRNKPQTVEPELKALSADRAIDWYMRIHAIEALISTAARRDTAALDSTLDWVADLAADDTEDGTLRLSIGNKLLDFPRLHHRALVERLGKQQIGPSLHYSANDIERAYGRLADAPGWERFDDPWTFYRPERIAARQERWAREDAEREPDENLYAGGLPHTYFRLTPKIGRNDPCPCGSGKKHKKCCLIRDEA